MNLSEYLRVVDGALSQTTIEDFEAQAEFGPLHAGENIAQARRVVWELIADKRHHLGIYAPRSSKKRGTPLADRVIRQADLSVHFTAVLDSIADCIFPLEVKKPDQVIILVRRLIGSVIATFPPLSVKRRKGVTLREFDFLPPMPSILPPELQVLHNRAVAFRASFGYTSGR